MPRTVKELARKRTLRLVFLGVSQVATFAASGLFAFLLRFDFTLPRSGHRFVFSAIPVWIVIKSIAFHFARLDRRGYRYVSVRDAYRILLTNLIGSIASYPIILLLAPNGFPRSIYLIDLVVCIVGTAGGRVAVRLIAESHNGHGTKPEKRALIYGAGDAGITLLREIRNNPRLAYKVCGFLDDHLVKKGVLINGVPVLGGGANVASLVKERDIEIILIAIPSASGVQMTRILELCHAADVECKTVPGLGEIIEGHGLAGQIREVAVEDLLGRTPVHLEEKQIRSTIAGRMIMVTGAAGSIGSELCRQIARFRPAGIVGFEMAESPLFDIDQEMKRSFPEIPFHPEIGTIQSRARLDEVFRKHQPAVVFHAAAYKHVPLMETHVFEAVENNVLGTYNLAQASLDNGVEDFVMISSDKAVRPTNIMGATKRLAELLLSSLQNGGTQFITVRFGNVLGSNGSVIPTFKKQIRAGGPVTVTHPDMRRFFMTIPEACQLVLQASAIGEGGQICVLDMGQPVKIVDLARNLILLSGLKPGDEIKIEYTGMRPGEKLYEELSSLTEDTVATQHEKIRIFVGSTNPDIDVLTWIGSLRAICAARDMSRLVVTIKELVIDYNPSAHLLRRILDIEDTQPVASISD
ncbi:MAG: polysaccharide biosynthesis protein [Acidobacteria bacterium]|nr:polysaccharide biosynthesis protein [Acidobacteriota bacterium]